MNRTALVNKSVLYIRMRKYASAVSELRKRSVTGRCFRLQKDNLFSMNFLKEVEGLRNDVESGRESTTKGLQEHLTKPGLLILNRPIFR